MWPSSSGGRRWRSSRTLMAGNSTSYGGSSTTISCRRSAIRWASFRLSRLVLVWLFCACWSSRDRRSVAGEDTPGSIVVGIGSSSQAQEMGANISKILNAFFTGGYDRRVRPNYGGPPVEVGITMFIISISTVSEVKMDFTSDFYFRQAWNDPRLSFDPLPGISNLYVGAEVAKKIWVPDTFFANEKSAYFHTATTPNRFLRISSQGDVFQSIR